MTPPRTISLGTSSRHQQTGPDSPSSPDNSAGPLVQRIKAAPLLADPDAARERFETWLGGIDGFGDAAADLRTLLDGAPKARDLLIGLADGSPYLWDLVSTDAPRLLRLLTAEPEIHLATLLACRLPPRIRKSRRPCAG